MRPTSLLSVLATSSLASPDLPAPTAMPLNPRADTDTTTAHKPKPTPTSLCYDPSCCPSRHSGDPCYVAPYTESDDSYHTVGPVGPPMTVPTSVPDGSSSASSTTATSSSYLGPVGAQNTGPTGGAGVKVGGGGVGAGVMGVMAVVGWLL